MSMSMSMSMWRRALKSIGATVAATVALVAGGQDLPNKTIQLVVPFPHAPQENPNHAQLRSAVLCLLANLRCGEAPDRDIHQFQRAKGAEQSATKLAAVVIGCDHRGGLQLHTLGAQATEGQIQDTHQRKRNQERKNEDRLIANPLPEVSDAELMRRVQKAQRMAGTLQKLLSSLIVLESVYPLDVEEALARVHAEDGAIPF